MLKHKIINVISILLIYCSTASAEPITLSGINWANSKNESINILTKNGFICEDISNIFIPDKPPIGTSCSKDNGKISFYDDEIRFNCGLFNMCDMSLKEAAQNLVATNKIKSLGMVLVQADKWLGTSTHFIYCGQGDDGEKVCLKPAFDGSDFGSLYLEKSSFGKKVGFE